MLLLAIRMFGSSEAVSRHHTRELGEPPSPAPSSTRLLFSVFQIVSLHRSGHDRDERVPGAPAHIARRVLKEGNLSPTTKFFGIGDFAGPPRLLLSLQTLPSSPYSCVTITALMYCWNWQVRSRNGLILPGTRTELTPPGAIRGVKQLGLFNVPFHRHTHRIPYPTQETMPLVSRHILLEFLFPLHTVTSSDLLLCQTGHLIDSRATQWSRGNTSSYRDPYLRGQEG